MGLLEKNEGKQKLKYENSALITFVGFREHLSVGFINNINVKSLKVTKIYLFTSSPSVSGYDEKTNEIITRHLDKIKKISKDRFGDVEIETVELEDIWEINKIYTELNVIKERSGIANLSAGPSSFSLSLLLWIINKPGYLLSHVKEESRTIDKEPIKFEFRTFNIMPYLNLILNLDDSTKKLLEVIGNGNVKIKEIQKSISQGINKKSNIPYKTLYEKIKNLNNLGIIEITKNRYIRVRISDDIISIIGDRIKLT